MKTCNDCGKRIWFWQKVLGMAKFNIKTNPPFLESLYYMHEKCWDEENEGD